MITWLKEWWDINVVAPRVAPLAYRLVCCLAKRVPQHGRQELRCGDDLRVQVDGKWSLNEVTRVTWAGHIVLEQKTGGLGGNSIVRFHSGEWIGQLMRYKKTVQKNERTLRAPCLAKGRSKDAYQ